jgi:hypothetical protein
MVQDNGLTISFIRVRNISDWKRSSLCIGLDEGSQFRPGAIVRDKKFKVPGGLAQVAVEHKFQGPHAIVNRNDD